jgi:hypothetical protein
MDDTTLGGGSRERERPEFLLNSRTPVADAPAAPPVQQLLDHERVYRTIELLRDNAQAPAAVADLVRRGTSVIPDLLEALERRDVELRRRVFMVLQHICGPGLAFDPHGPEAQRVQQLSYLRQQFLRFPAAG